MTDPTHTTGWPPSELMQDDCKGLSRALASKPDARLHAREAGDAIEREREAEGHLRFVWNTLMFFACESSYTTGERTGGVLQGCPRSSPPTVAEMAGYARFASAELMRYLGREPEEWLLAATPSPSLRIAAGEVGEATTPTLSDDAIEDAMGWTRGTMKNMEMFDMAYRVRKVADAAVALCTPGGEQR